MEDSAGHFEGYEVIAEDITQRQAIADQYHHAQKMEAVGLLAGGIAHDFNNLLTAVLGYAELLEAELQDEQLSMAQEIRKAATCASALTRQLLAFSRRQMYKPKLLDLNVIVADNVKMLSRMIGENIQLVTRLGAHASHFIADQAQMEQVLMNLAVNARDAMPDGGPLSIETETVHVDKIQDKSRTHQAPPGEYVMLSVGDTGCGIGSEVLPNIFEPFFTTKEEGKGTGLGLSTVYGIVRQSGGHIYVDSEVGVGTTFKIYLPSVREDPTERNTDDRRTIQARGSESILVVEDEGFIRRVVIRTLTEAGYTVCEACDGPDAISRAQDMPRLHLLIADMIMPGMGGREVAEKIRNLHPQTKVLFISGYTDDAIPHQGIFETGLAFLEKPFTPSGLSQAVREILDS